MYLQYNSLLSIDILTLLAKIRGRIQINALDPWAIKKNSYDFCPISSSIFIPVSSNPSLFSVSPRLEFLRRIQTMQCRSRYLTIVCDAYWFVHFCTAYAQGSVVRRSTWQVLLLPISGEHGGVRAWPYRSLLTFSLPPFPLSISPPPPHCTCAPRSYQSPYYI